MGRAQFSFDVAALRQKQPAANKKRYAKLRRDTRMRSVFVALAPSKNGRRASSLQEPMPAAARLATTAATPATTAAAPARADRPDRRRNFFHVPRHSVSLVTAKITPLNVLPSRGSLRTGGAGW